MKSHLDKNTRIRYLAKLTYISCLSLKFQSKFHIKQIFALRLPFVSLGCLIFSRHHYRRTAPSWCPASWSLGLVGSCKLTQYRSQKWEASARWAHDISVFGIGIRLSECLWRALFSEMYRRHPIFPEGAPWNNPRLNLFAAPSIWMGIPCPFF